MFSLAKIIIRTPNVRNYSKTYSKVDPGIHWRKKFLQNEEDLEDPDFEDVESDFMNAHKSHREHEAEVRYGKEKQQHYMIKQKYFKEKYPNFLTWSDKERIRYLHSNDPQEWTIEALSEGFPALPHVIKEIAKSKWTRDPRKVKHHDLSVQKNWESFKKGQLPNLPSQLVEHLNKFTNRALNLNPYEIPNDKKEVKTRHRRGNTEFADIITSYEELKNKNKNHSEEDCSEDDLQVNLNTTLEPPSKEDTYLTINRKQLKETRQVTLQVLQKKIEKKIQIGGKLSSDDKLIVEELEKRMEKDVTVPQEDIVDISQHKYETAEAALEKKPTRIYSHLIYPERITIPEDIRKEGGTYKLNDCYYDYDGRFLYRVPGMG